MSAAVTWYTSPVKTFDDLFTHEVTTGSTGMTDDTGRFPLLAKNLTGAKIINAARQGAIRRHLLEIFGAESERKQIRASG